MAKKKKGLFTRLIEGPERSEDYARKTLPKSRWSLGWDLFKTNTGKLVKINLLTLLFIFPVFALIYLRSLLIDAQAISSSFSQNVGVGYPAKPLSSMLGVAESIVFNADLTVLAILFFVSFYVSIGIAGGFYVMRNLVWTEGVFVVSDFWRGVKKNYWHVLKCTLLFVLVFGINVLAIDLCNIQIAVESGSAWLYSILQIIAYAICVLVLITYLYTLTLGVTYKHTFGGYIINAFILSVGFLPLNVFFIALGLGLTLILLVEMTSFFFSLGIMLLLFLSISVFMLVFTNYSQWAFDQVINDNVAGAKKYRGIYKQNSQVQPEDFVYKKSKFASRTIKPITDDEIEIAVLPESYSRKDLIKLEESKKLMIEDSERYAKEHENVETDEDVINEFMKDAPVENQEETKGKK